ncbi:uncharacterized protein LOC116287377 [Actinia tenebrosa]|uniref:Uncharacterized protein LOC116287377 n=1 Tax=Actinia tenebrosa TaxID=6105 RepID=A0A6P8H386_ACTTE|nr:uncharacterized protein LOC116287377 [Actinia tenebrosa]
MKTLYGLTKILCNEILKQSTAVENKNGNFLSMKSEVQATWMEHFKEVPNREQPANPITSEEENGFEFSAVMEEIAVNEPTIGEVKEAVKKLKNGKALGIDNITAELLKTNVEFSAHVIH